MSRILVLSLIVASLSTIVGCGASRATHVSDARDEACWTPPAAPGEIAMSFKESAAAPAGATGASSAEKMKTSYRPNRQERPTSGAVHAATY